ncbi:hypothetical protein KIN20_035535 [Parelaphostrongylus tenuis]|uniref:HTH OST-type domain-containing protein n=1 Tax=Parelaphostrongylus tenuis TaxID=148309 RepID=A0AAD5WJS4_PARTN|nr:hypothetical protein KIN20_035535 [Parelaphostrongylus tenuis]
MSNSELEDHLKCLNSVMLAMKEGATVAAIMKTYEQLNGKECNVAQFGFPNLETLFKSYPDLFYSQGGLWYGQVTDENKDIVRSMATEKSKRKGMNPLRTANHRRHYGAAARFRTGGHLNLHYDANKKNRIQEKGPFSEMRSEHGSWNRQAPTQRGPPTSRVFSFSSEDGSLPDQGVNSKALIWEAPPGFQNQQPLFDNRDRHTPEKEIKPRSFQSVVSGGAASPLLPPGITISAPQNQLRVQSNPISTTEKEKQKMPEMDYLARKIEDLLSNFPEGLPIREISARLDIWAKDDFTPNAQVGFVVKKFSNTFSLSASNGDGIVKVINGAVRPGGSEASNRTRGKEDDSSKWSRPTKTIPNVSNETYFDAVGRNTLTHSNSLTSAVQKPLYENFDGRNWEVNEDSISSRGISARRGGSHFFNGFRDDYESRGSTMSLSPSRRDDRRNSPVTLINGYHRRPEQDSL